MARLLLDVSAVPTRPVGAGVYTVELARNLSSTHARARGHELVLLSRRDDAARWHQIAPAAEVTADVPASRPARLAWEQTRAKAIASRCNVDLWLGPHYTMPLNLGVPAVVTIHDLTFFDHPELHERSKVLFFRAAIRAAARRAAGVVAVSAYTARRLADLAPPHGLVRVAHHGVDHRRFNPAGDVDVDLARLARHGISGRYVAFIGTHEPRKNLPVLIEAFSRIASDHPDLRLVLAGGDGWGSRAVRDAVAASGHTTRVVRPGYLPDDVVPAFLRRAAVVAYPSREEGFGLPVLEAMACATPVVTSRGSATGEAAGDAAILVAPGNAAALATALRHALDPETASRLGDAGLQRASRFSWDESVRAHLDLYDEVLSLRPADTATR